MVDQSDRHKILIVEDNEDTLELLAEQLGDEGYGLLLAADGQEAILRAGAEAPSLVIMDLMIPRLNGFEATRFFKARFSDRYLPVLILSAKSDEESIRQGIQLGCDDYMTKPYSAPALRQAVANLVALYELESALADEEASEEERSGARGELVARRLEMAQGFVERNLRGLSRAYLKRNLELVPDHPASTELLGQLSGQEG